MRYREFEQHRGLNEMASPVSFPIKKLTKLWHVGSLNPNDKRTESYEGSGLSVTTHPDAWMQISTEIQGALWEVTKPNGQFLDCLKLRKTHRGAIAEWGIQEGYVVSSVIYRVSWEDNETEEIMHMDFEDYKEAEYEAEDMDDSEI